MPGALLLLSTLWLVIVAWLIVRAWRQNGALMRVLPPPSGAPPYSGPPPHSGSPAPAAAIAVIVPARDEAANIGPCIESVMAQQYPCGQLAILVVDDDSRDRTAAIVQRLASRDPRVRVLPAPPLPAGWKGKVHACWHAARHVPESTAWLCFLDADMRADPHLLAAAVRAAEAGRIDLLSLAPRHLLGSFAERLIIPCGMYLLGFSQDLARIQAPESEDVVCTGQFMLVRRSAYEAVGGFSQVREAICEDVQFARLMKGRGRCVLLADGSALLLTRMYSGWRTLWPGIAKNLVDMLGGAPRAVVMALAAVVLAWAGVLLPVIDAVACARGTPGACIALILALMGSGAAFGLHLAGAVHFRIPWWYGLLFPIGYSAGAMIAFDSIRWRLVRRVHWKGRTYA